MYWATSLHGLERLESVGGDLALTSVHLQNLEALSGLRRIGGSLVITGSSGDALVDLQGLEGLTELGGLELFWTHALRSLRGLPSFTHFTGDVLIEGALSLTSLDALGELRRIGVSTCVSAGRDEAVQRAWDQSGCGDPAASLC